MKPFQHFNARSVEEAVSLLHEHGEGARAIAGGTDLLGLMKNQVIAPQVLVNLKTVPGLASIVEEAGQGLRLGPLVTISELEGSKVVRERYPLLARAAASVGAPQLRNMGTLGGNLCQEVRCWYFRRSPRTGLTFPCRRKGGKLCYAATGDHRYEAILGGRRCIAASPSDLAPALIALGARVKTASPAGGRVMPLEDFYRVMGNVLQPGEIITEVQVPAPEAGTRQSFLKFRLRQAIDFAISSVAASITVGDREVAQARIVLGGVAPFPYRAVKAEEALKGKALSQGAAEAAAEAALARSRPLKMNAYKVPLTYALVKRAILG